MGIRNLTSQLKQETSESQRVQKFQSSRNLTPAAQDKPAGTKQTPFMAGRGQRHETQTSAPPPFPVEAPAPKVGLKERENASAYGIPGGIAARFGREALNKTPVTQQPPEPEDVPEEPLEPVEEIRAEEDTTSVKETEPAQEQEREAEKDDDAARITIELQSH